MKLKTIIFNPFQVNTFILYDETKECVIIDAGCYYENEKKELTAFIEKNELKPVKLLATHCHLDHQFGNKFIFEKYGLRPEVHKSELEMLKMAPEIGRSYGIPISDPSPIPKSFIDGEQTIKFGNSSLKTIHAPGHSTGSICFYAKNDNFLISGDVLFRNSIGRTDLPNGNYNTLIESIQSKLMILDDDVAVYPGHGPATTIGYERKHNPFLVFS